MNLRYFMVGFALCFSVFISKQAYSQRYPHYLIIKNLDKRGYMLPNEWLNLKISVYPTKGVHITAVRVNNKPMYLPRRNTPRTKLSNWQKITKTGKVAIPVYIEYIYKRTKKKLYGEYTLKVVQPDSSHAKQIFLGVRHTQLAVTNSAGAPIKAQYCSNSPHLKIHQNRHTLYVTAYQAGKYQVGVYYQGHKINQLLFVTKALPPPKIYIMDGYQRYKLHDRPLLSSGLKYTFLEDFWQTQRMIGNKKRYLRATQLKISQYRNKQLVVSKTIMFKYSYALDELFDCKQGDWFHTEVTKAVHTINKTIDIPIDVKGIKIIRYWVRVD